MGGSGYGISDPGPATSGSGSASGSASGPGSSFSAPQPPAPQQQPQRKRTRPPLSCKPCRASKQRCDRARPCGQCVRKTRAQGCVYAEPRGPEKVRPASSGLADRLKRLEGMVRDMMGREGGDRPSAEEGEFSRGWGQVVVVGGKGGKTTTYVGATHFMAMLDDIEDLKSYFDNEEPVGADPDPDPYNQSPDIFMVPTAVPRSRQELLGYLPLRPVVDRLTMRYFNAYSPSQHTIHRPTFVKQYAEFWENPDGLPLDWIALLFMILALGTFLSTFTAPHEIENDSDGLPMERFQQYRRVAGWALVSAKYTCPGPMTLQPFLLYVEAEFLTNQSSHMNCYLLSSVCIRLMLKMGLHRDPSRLPNISPFDGEMRRRIWNLAIQFDLIVSFHMGLPSMVNVIESDTGLPRNLVDEDLDGDCFELPPSRPDSEYTQLTYPIWKSSISRIFGLVASQAHSLSLPTYNEVMKLDHMLEEKWKQVPPFMKVKPLEDSITAPPYQVNQRFGLGSLYQKTRCVLHRRYLMETPPNKEHEYSRRACLDAGLHMLQDQATVYQATLPGGLLRQNGWFITPLAVYDFLLAAMIIYLIIQNEAYSDWMGQESPLPSKDELHDVLRRSHAIWVAVSKDAPVAKKAADILGTMLKKLGVLHGPRITKSTDGQRHPSSDLADDNTNLETDPSLGPGSMSHLSIHEPPPYQELVSPQLDTVQQRVWSRSELMPNYEPEQVMDTPWLPLESAVMDWDTFDEAIRPDTNPESQVADEWMQRRASLSDLDFMAAGSWEGQDGSFQEQ